MSKLDKIKDKIKGSKFLHSRKAIVVITLIVILLCVIVALKIKHDRQNMSMNDMPDGGSVGMVMRGDISNELSSSGTLSPKNTYSITSLVSGEIIEADFEEGDQVSEGQTLFVIDTSEISSDIEAAERNLEKAQKNYDDAMKDRSESLSKLSKGIIRSTAAGYVKNITLKDGDSVSAEAEIADLYNDAQMSFRAAFLDTDAARLGVGQDMFVEINDTGEVIPGKILSISDLTEVLDGGIPVKYVEIYVTNPGGLTSADTANAYMGDVRSLSSGAFKAMKSDKLKADVPVNVEVGTVLIHEGQYVSVGTPLFTVKKDSLEDAIKNVNDAADQAEDALKSAEDQKTKLDDTIDRYTITAPISGQVISKDLKAGDKVNSANSTTSQLALIYDLSELTFQMSIDELDISKVKAGQRVEVTADAVTDKTYQGHVSNVSLKGTAQNGITTYPVVVKLDESEGLLPGMNVTGIIKLEEASDTLYVPSGALQRGDLVYVKNESLTADNNTASADTDYTDDDFGADSEDIASPDAVGETVAAGVSSNHTSVNNGAAAPQAPGGGGKDGPKMDKDGRSGESIAAGEASVQFDSGGQATNGAEFAADSDSDTEFSEGFEAYDVPEGFTAVKVKTGIISDQYVEILEGLSEGQEVYVKDTASDDMFGGDMFMYGGPGYYG
ncbi:MAG: HlyD family efflux transporter periplasmic adaptor subunit [Eubacteriales bacterium]|nr:HlyD family efflux transporter periplasmic adaptor subunit [Eubacteriales bacterium]